MPYIPVWTFLEKLYAVYSVALKIEADPEGMLRGRTRRHGYDIYQLLESERVLEIVADPEQRDEILDDIGEFNRRYFGGTERPRGGFATSAAFDGSSSASELLGEEYARTVPELYFGADPLPTWGEIEQRVRDNGL